MGSSDLLLLYVKLYNIDFFTPGGKLVAVVLIKANDKFPDIELLENKDKIMYQ